MKQPGKRLVLCLDGTWQNTYKPKKRDDGSKVLKPSNVLKMSRSVKAHDEESGCEQVTFYDPGVGALVQYPGLSNKILTFVDSKLGGAWGAGFESNVEEAFRFLVHNYSEGDQVFLFGFSRGAAEARALTRFIDWLGGIPTKLDAYFSPLFLRHYIVTRGKGDPAEVVTASGKRPSNPLTQINIELLGVWDTVMALGSRFGASKGTSEISRSFHVGPRPAACVNHARQALAIDEKRYDFRPEVWRESGQDQSLEQRWFAGCHANVGGGYVHDGVANVPFRWLLDEARKFGLNADKDYFKHYNPYLQDRLYDSMSNFYKVLEAVRFKRNKGKRGLLGYPSSANLSVDSSAIKRMCSQKKDHERLEPYRPENLIIFLAAQPDLDEYLEKIGIETRDPVWPPDVVEMITRAKSN